MPFADALPDFDRFSGLEVILSALVLLLHTEALVSLFRGLFGDFGLAAGADFVSTAGDVGVVVLAKGSVVVETPVESEALKLGVGTGFLENISRMLRRPLNSSMSFPEVGCMSFAAYSRLRTPLTNIPLGFMTSKIRVLKPLTLTSSLKTA